MCDLTAARIHFRYANASRSLSLILMAFWILKNLAHTHTQSLHMQSRCGSECRRTFQTTYRSQFPLTFPFTRTVICDVFFIFIFIFAALPTPAPASFVSTRIFTRRHKHSLGENRSENISNYHFYHITAKHQRRHRPLSFFRGPLFKFK